MNIKLVTHKSRLCVRITENRKSSYIFLPVTLVPEYWSNEASMPMPKHPNYRALVNYIADTQDTLERARIELLAARISGPKAKILIEEAFFGKNNVDESLAKFAQNLIDEQIANKKPGNAKWYKQAVDSFIKFNVKDVYFNEISYNTLVAYRNSLKADGLSNNSISNYLRALRAIYREADRRDLINPEVKYPFKVGLIPGTTSTIPRNISKEDIEKLEKSQFQNLKVQQAVDFWLIGFYLQGADFIDISNLTNFNLSGNYFKFSRAKTGQPVCVRITNKLSQRIEKYWNGNPGYILPVLSGPITNPKEMELYQNKLKSQNKYIKIAAKELGITANVSSKWLRHSWITIAKRLYVDEDIRRQAVGHRDKSTSHSIYSDDFKQSVVDAANSLVIGEIDYNAYSMLIKQA